MQDSVPKLQSSSTLGTLRAVMVELDCSLGRTESKIGTCDSGGRDLYAATSPYPFVIVSIIPRKLTWPV